jgi:hypothetical protein
MRRAFYDVRCSDFMWVTGWVIVVLFGIPGLVAGAGLFPDHSLLFPHLVSLIHRSPEFSHVIYVLVPRASTLAETITTQHFLLAVHHNRLCLLLNTVAYDLLLSWLCLFLVTSQSLSIVIALLLPCLGTNRLWPPPSKTFPIPHSWFSLPQWMTISDTLFSKRLNALKPLGQISRAV